MRAPCFSLTLAFTILATVPIVGSDLVAQHPHTQERRVEVGLGIAAPILQGGTELLRARDLRSNGSSYHRRTDGSRRSVGSYPALLGFSLNLGFHVPLRRIDGAMWGASVRHALTGTQPSAGGYEEGYFFNTVTASLSGRYYPLPRRALFAVGELGVGSVLTKNRFIDSAGEQAFHHQFGIGPAAAIGVGYSIEPFEERGTRLELQVIYQQLRTRVEVDEIGNDHWTSGGLNLVLGLGF